MGFPEGDRMILRDLARRVMEIAALPVQQEKRRMWTKLNRLEPVRPMVWINETPWDELKDEVELRCACRDPFCRDVEHNLRWTLYTWNHLRTDTVVDPVYYTSQAFGDTGFGVDAQEVRRHEGTSGFGSCDYVPIMKTDADIERIKTPKITLDPKATERKFQQVSELIGDVIPVEKRGIAHMWCAPWDYLIRWWGIEELYTDMVDRPAFVHKGIARMMDALVCRLDQLEELGLLAASNGNHRVGSGGLGITDELPGRNHDPKHVTPMNQWGTSTGQIFSEVSPAMHDEFCLQYELRWLERFGLNCYGCCEPLQNKMDILRQIPRLRRISMSTWVDIDMAAERMARDYVFSYKPNPAVLAWDQWNPDQARADLRKCLERTRGCVVELIMKDVSTCRRDPRRLWEWCELAVDVAEEFPY